MSLRDGAVIGIDYTLASRHAPGAGRYVREFVRALVRLDDRPDLALFEGGRVPAVLPEAALGLDGAAGVRRREVRWPRRALLLASRLGVGPDRFVGDVALFHHARVEPLVARVPEVVPVAELPPAGSGAERAAVSRLRRVARVLVFSRAMAERLASLGVDERRVAAVPVGADHWARELGERPPPADPPVVVVLGAVRPERRHHVVLAACERLRARGVEVALDVLGREGDPRGPFETARAASPMRDAVTRSVPGEEELTWRLAAASAVVQLEDDPGTPVTPLEAMALGVPVVASRAPAFVEALADAPVWIGNEEAERAPERLADALLQAFEQREARAARGREVAGAFTWEANARATLGEWGEALEARRATRARRAR